MIKSKLPLKLDLKHSPSQHLAKIVKGMISQIPVVGPIIIEYVSIRQDDDVPTVQEVRSYKYEEEWCSEDEKQNFIVRENGFCEQHGQADLA